jgi:hypothetical protein
LLAINVYQNFNAIDDILKSPPEQVQKDVHFLGQQNIRLLLRYTAGIENVNVFDTWEEIQIGLGLLAMMLLFLESSTRALSAVPLAMTLLVLFVHFKITPDMGWYHRLFAFTAWTAESRPRDQFWRLHGIYELLEVVKGVLGIGLVVFLSLGQSSRHVRRKRHRAEGDGISDAHRNFASR